MESSSDSESDNGDTMEDLDIGKGHQQPTIETSSSI